MFSRSTWHSSRCSLLGSTQMASFSTSAMLRAYVPPSRRNAAKSTMAPKLSTDRAPKTLLDKMDAKQLGNFYKRDSTTQKIKEAKRRHEEARAALDASRESMNQAIDMLKNYDVYIATLTERYKHYAWVAAVILAILTHLYVKNWKSKKKLTAAFYDPTNSINDDPEFNDARIARSDFLIQSKLGISSNAYLALIDPHNLFIYNNVPITDQMADWIPDTVNQVHIVVPNALHNFLLRKTVLSINDALPKAEIHVYLREGSVEKETLNEWNKSQSEQSPQPEQSQQPEPSPSTTEQQSTPTTHHESQPTVLLTDTVATSNSTTTTPAESSHLDKATTPPESEFTPFFHVVKSVDDYPAPIRERFDIFPIEGMPDHDETFFLDRKHRFLVVCDLLANVTSSTFPKNKFFFSSLYAYYSLKGLTNKITPFPPLAYQKIRENIDEEALVKSLDQIAFLPDVHGIIMAHGEPIFPRANKDNVSDELITWRASWQERSPRFSVAYDEDE